MRKMILSVLLLTAALAGPARAEIVLGDEVYPESDRAELGAICRGLFAQSMTSSFFDAPDDEYSGDPASEYQLSSITFTVRDCREAGLI